MENVNPARKYHDELIYLWKVAVCRGDLDSINEYNSQLKKLRKNLTKQLK